MQHRGTKHRHLIATNTRPRALPELVGWGQAVRDSNRRKAERKV